MKKNKILLVCALALGLPSAVSSLMHNVEPIVARAAEKIDTFTSSNFAATENTYTDFNNVKLNKAVYAGNTAKSSAGGIQLKSKDSKSGIVSTTSGGKIKSVSIVVASGKNTLDIYASNTPFTSATDLYKTATQGTKVGSLSQTGIVEITGDYTYVGVRSNKGAIYLTSISFTWDEIEETKYSVILDANGGTFDDKTSSKEIKIDLNNDTTINFSNYSLNAPYKYTKLTKWFDGTKEYATNATITVSSATAFKAQWEAEKILNVNEALEIANDLKSSANEMTTINFVIQGIIKEFDSKYPDTFTIVDSLNDKNELKIFNPSTKVADSKAIVGDKVQVTGKIQNYSNTLEITDNPTYIIMPKSFDEEIKNVKPVSNLNFSYTKTSSNIQTITKEVTISDVATLNGISSNVNLDECFVTEDKLIKLTGSKGNATIAPRFWNSGKELRTYLGNIVTINGVGDTEIKSIIYNKKNEIVKNNNNEFVITSKETITSLKIVYCTQNVSYSNFDNVQLQFQYTFDYNEVLNSENIVESGLVVTNDETYDFADTSIISTDKSSKVRKFINLSKDNQIKTTFTLGIVINNLTQAKARAKFYVKAYVFDGDNYYFTDNTKVTSVVDEINYYKTLDTLTDEAKSIINSFGEYVTNLD